MTVQSMVSGGIRQSRNSFGAVCVVAVAVLVECDDVARCTNGTLSHCNFEVGFTEFSRRPSSHQIAGGSPSPGALRLTCVDLDASKVRQVTV